MSDTSGTLGDVTDPALETAPPFEVFFHIGTDSIDFVHSTPADPAAMAVVLASAFSTFLVRRVPFVPREHEMADGRKATLDGLIRVVWQDSTIETTLLEEQGAEYLAIASTIVDVLDRAGRTTSGEKPN